MNQVITDESIKKSYQEIAPQYDLRYNSAGGQLIHEIQCQKLYEIIKELPLDAKILEMGCGTGRFLKFLFEKGYKNLHGLDQSNNMLYEAKLKVDAKFTQGTIYATHYPANHFDFVYSIHVLMHLENPPLAFNEMCRISKGIVLFEVNNKWSFAGVGKLLNKIRKLLGVTFLTNPHQYSIRKVKNYFNLKTFEIVPTYRLPLNNVKLKVYFQNYKKLAKIHKRIFGKYFSCQYFLVKR